MDMRNNRKLSPNSIRSHISAIQTFLIIDYNVDDRSYTRDEIKKLVEGAYSLRDIVIILLLSSSGLRVVGLVRL